MCINLYKLSNRILDLGLTSSELHVFAYPCSIHSTMLVAHFALGNYLEAVLQCI